MKKSTCDECTIELLAYNKAKILIVEDNVVYSDQEVTVGPISQKAHYNGFKKSDYTFCNAVQCFNSNPKKKEINTCSERLKSIIAQVDPKVIILACSEKSIGIKSIFGGITKFPGIGSIHGLKIPYQDRWILPVFSPIASRNKNMESVINIDLMNTFKFCKDIPTIPKIPIYEDTVILVDYDQCMAVLNSMIRRFEATGEISAFDYETTGLNSRISSHRILSIAIAMQNPDGRIISYAFPIDYPRVFTKAQSNNIKCLVRRYLNSEKIFKVAHNATFEKTWSKNIFGVDASNMQCTQVTQHILDVRPKITSLKIQALLRYGIDDYAKSSRKFIEADETGFNKMHKMPLEELLLYNGVDSLITMQLFLDQQKELIAREMEYPNMFFTEGMNLLQKISNNGICVDTEYFRNESEKLQKEIQELTNKIMTSSEILGFIEKKKEDPEIKKKSKKEVVFNFNSSKQMQELLFSFLGFKSKKSTKTGKDSVDAEVLNEIDHWITKDLMEIRKKQKVNGTYLSQFLEYEVDGKVYPSFSLNIARSLRSSSFEPNMQNIPKRVEEISNLIRRGIKPSPGNRLIEIDFSGAEVIVSACVVGSTRIETITGQKTILEIIEEIKHSDVHVFGYDLKKKRIAIAKVTDGGLTGRKKKIVKVTLDNGKYELVTEDHKFLIRDNRGNAKYVAANDLKSNMSLMPFCTKEKNGYLYVNLNNRKQLALHTLIGVDVLQKDVGGSYGSDVIHHIDGNGLNNTLQNLQFMKRPDHISLHHKGKTSGPMKEETKRKLSESMKGKKCPQRGRPRSIERKRLQVILSTGRSHSNTSKQKMSLIRKEYWRSRKPDVCCGVCGKLFKTLTNTHLLHAHNILSMEEYKRDYNHKVKSVEFYGYEDVYNINVAGIHNYAVSSGVIVKNCYHKDPVFVNYLVNENTDMHRDLAMDIFLLKQDEVTKEIRFYGKNMFTFAEFYGDYYRNCAKNLWNIIDIKTVSGIVLRDHLAKKGIKTLEQFEDHLSEVEDNMWNVRFKVYTAWKKSVNKEYLDTGIVKTYLGFQYTGYLDQKQTTNYQIQGTSFHLLLYVLILMQEWIEENNLKTKIVSEVHDSGVFDSPANEYRAVIKQFMIFVGDLKDEFPWLPLPMTAEAEISEVDGNLAEMTKFEILYDV